MNIAVYCEEGLSRLRLMFIHSQVNDTTGPNHTLRRETNTQKEMLKKTGLHSDKDTKRVLKLT